MNTLTIKDTHEEVTALQSSGASRELSEQIIKTIQNARLESEPATKADVKDLRAEMYRALLIHGLLVVAAIHTLSKIA